MSGVTWLPLDIRADGGEHLAGTSQQLAVGAAHHAALLGDGVVNQGRDPLEQLDQVSECLVWGGEAGWPEWRGVERHAQSCLSAWASSRSGWALAPVATALTCAPRALAALATSGPSPTRCDLPEVATTASPATTVANHQPASRGDHRGDPRRHGSQDVPRAWPPTHQRPRSGRWRRPGTRRRTPPE